MEKYEKIIRILGRSFPLRVSPSEEVVIDAAVQLIQDTLHDYKTKYNINDDLNLAIMCCIKLAVDFIEEKKGNQQFQGDLSLKLMELNRALETTLSSSNESGLTNELS